MGSEVICENSTDINHYGRDISEYQNQEEPEQHEEQEETRNKLLISNIPQNVSWDDVKTLISQFGNLLQLEQVNATTDSVFSVLVDFESESVAQDACNHLNGLDYRGAELKAELQMDDKQEKDSLEKGREEAEASAATGGNGVASTSSTGGGGDGESSQTGSTGGGERSHRRRLHPFIAGSMRQTDFPLRILVLSDMVGAIIGRSGGTIKRITQETRARVDVHRKENVGSFEKVITIYGQPENCSKACQRIMEVMQQEAISTNRGEIPLKILAHNNLIGRIIGKSGNTIKRIMEQTNTKITVSSHIHDINNMNLERVIAIKGTIEDVCAAEQMISAKLKQCYDSDLATMVPQVMFPGLHPYTMMSTLGSTPHGYLGAGPSGYGPGGPSTSSASPYGLYGAQPYMPPLLPYSPGAPSSASALPGAVSGGAVGQGATAAGPSLPPSSQDLTKEVVNIYIPRSAVGAIIGTGGNTIRDMITSSNAVIKVAQPTKDETSEGAQGDRKVTIIGTPEAQWKAQFMVFRKASYEGLAGPQEQSLKVEIFVPSSQVGRIIGKGGQNVRDLQRITRAIIKLPEEQTHTADEIPVHMIGDFLSTQAAQRQIRALVTRGTQAPSTTRGGARPKSYTSSSQQPQTQPQQEEPSQEELTSQATTTSVTTQQSKEEKSEHSPSAPLEEQDKDIPSKKW